MSDEPTLEFHNDGQDLFVLVDGVKIAKRAAPPTVLAMTWIMLEPGWVIHDIRKGTAIEVRFEGARIH
jgi:hypothetical protein